MLLKKLIVRKTKPIHVVIREVEFNLQGLNLIVDDTKNLSKESGNSVGKTTVIKLIDLCLGGKSTSYIYKDKDTNTENIDIKNLLNTKKVEAELIVLDKNNTEHSIVRQLYANGKKKIDDIEYNEADFWFKLKELFFGSTEDKPKFRQLIPRFIRIDEKQLDNLINYLEMTSKETYEVINLFLLRQEEDKLLSKKNILEEELRSCKNRLEYYRKDKNILSLAFLEQRLKIINKDLDEWVRRRSELDYMDTYKDELNKKNCISQQIDSLSQEIELITFDRNLIEKSLMKLNSEKCNIDLIKIRELYQDASRFNEKLDKTFEDVVNFHNTMIENRIKFIMLSLKSKTEKLSSLNKEMDLLLKEKQKLSIELVDEGLLKDLEALNKEIDGLNIQKGELLKSIQILTDANDEINALELELGKLNSQMNGSEGNKIEIFNEFFSEYSQRLYGEKYVFVYNKNWRNEKNKSPFSVGNLQGSVGTGKKRGLIVAFDLAYLKYIDKFNIQAPQFIIHDKLENTHINQLDTIFHICEEINGQYIVPILRERVASIDQNLINKAKIIELSEDDKFFRI